MQRKLKWPVSQTDTLLCLETDTCSILTNTNTFSHIYPFFPSLHPVFICIPLIELLPWRTSSQVQSNPGRTQLISLMIFDFIITITIVYYLSSHPSFLSKNLIASELILFHLLKEIGFILQWNWIQFAINLKKISFAFYSFRFSLYFISHSN